MAIKKRTKSQRVGARGENAFGHAASSIGLLPTKVAEDFGVDFLCQVERASTGAIAEIGGGVLGVAVRATESHRGRIRLNRDDVETLLNCQFPAMIALVRLGEHASDDQVYLRLVDCEFAAELQDFLLTPAGHVSFTPNAFNTLADAPRLIAVATKQGFSERVRLSLTRRGLASVLPNVQLQIQRTADGQLSLVKTSNFLSQFDVSTDQAKKKLNDALFGSSKHFSRRMADLDLKEELWRSLNALPQPVVISGPVTVGRTTLVVEGTSVGCSFEARAGVGFIAFVHVSGFSIRVSDACAGDGEIVHYVSAEVDPEVPVSYGKHAELWAFLAACTPNKRWKCADWHGEGISLEQSGDLRRFAWLAHYIGQTQGPIGWPSGLWRLSDAKSDEALDTLAVAKIAAFEPKYLSGALKYSKDEDAAEVPVELTIPVCSNLPHCGLVLWLHAEGTALVQEEGVGGVTISKIRSITAEAVDRVFPKSSSKPELVLYSHWPTLALGPHPESTASDASSWGYETLVHWL